ncbi:MAG TPA: prenyltransferase/squalene oxidase repeat-containing protein [Planctomycetota bacterium]|jgi:hypothetical protein|nr:prenyltransferase/squalene oxidase repeat-containing protein [Planctomycetota bacterium]
MEHKPDLATVVKSAVRNSPWMVIAVMLHVVLIAVMSVVYIHHARQKEEASPTTVAVAAPKEMQEDLVEPPQVIDRKAIPKNEQAEIVEYERDIFIPHSEQQPDEDLTQEAGDPDSLTNLPSGASGGTAMGVGGAGHYSKGVSPFSSRRPGTGQAARGRAAGATQGTEKAVLEGLRWLLRHQNPDGSWDVESLNDRCIPESRCLRADAPVSSLKVSEGLTALSLLAFLGAGYSNESKQDVVDTVKAKRHRVGEAVKNGLQWLAKRQKADGSFSADRPFLYNEALATLALAEAYGVTQNRYWRDYAQKGVDFLVAAQRPNPNGQGLWGWRYAPRAEVEKRIAEDPSYDKKELHDSDISVTGWVVMALKSADLSGLKVPPEVYDGAMEFTKFVTGTNGQVGYLDARQAGLKVSGVNDHYTYHPATMSALAACARIFGKKDPTDPFFDLAAKQMIADLPAVTKDQLSIDYYYWYYGSLALNQLDGPDSPRKTGKFWGPWNRAMTEAVLGLQEKEERSCRRGGWIVGDRWCYAGGPIYSTAINVLTLEVFYRYENAFGGAKTAFGSPKPK